MPITFRFKNYDDIYHRLKTEKILINHEDIFDAENKEKLDAIILKNYSEDNLSIIPSCNCGELKGGYYIGNLCHKCNTHVVSSIDDDVAFLLWLEKPMEVERFISPIVLSILLARYKITKPNVQLIRYIMVPTYQPDRRQQKKNMEQLDKLNFLLEQNGIKRGYNSFIQNFFKIIEILETEFLRRKEEYNFYEFLWNNKDLIFSNYLPFPNRIIFAMESNELGKFIDKNLLNPINVIRRLTGIDLHTKPSVTKQRRVATSLIDLADFYVPYMKNVVFNKQGLIRQHISSTRSHFTMRAVITNIPGYHQSNEIYLPWSAACSLFREHILNQLYKNGMNYKQASNFLQFHNRIFHPLLDNIFKLILQNRVKCFLNRNPSLHRGSIQTVVITKIKSDPLDTSISMSDLIAPNFNADYDGKQHCCH